MNNNELETFVIAFKNKLGRTPNEYIIEKINTGSQIDDIRYLFDVVSAQISYKNECKYFDFDYFYNMKKN